MTVVSSGPVRTRRTWDLVLAIVLAVGLVVLAAVLGFAGLFLVMASDGCGTVGPCADDRLGAGVLIAAIGPAVVAVVALAATIVRLVRARIAFWVPLVGVALQASVFAAGTALVFSAVPTS